MTTRVSKLTALNARALRDHCGDLLEAQGATFAVFRGTPGAALVALQVRITELGAEYGRKQHPVASLHAVVRKLAEAYDPEAGARRDAWARANAVELYGAPAAPAAPAPVCVHCGLVEAEHGSRGWCDSAATGEAPGTTSYELELEAGACGWCGNAGAACTRCRECGNHGSLIGTVCSVCDAVTGCRWYALCPNPALGTAAHPVLGAVPVCAECAARHELEVELAPGTSAVTVEELERGDWLTAQQTYVVDVIEGAGGVAVHCSNRGPIRFAPGTIVAADRLVTR